MNASENLPASSPLSVTAGFGWIDSNRTRGFATWEDEISHMANLGYALVPAEYKIAHWSETMRAGEPIPKLYVNTCYGPRKMESAFDRYAAEIGYPLFFKPNAEISHDLERKI